MNAFLMAAGVVLNIFLMKKTFPDYGKKGLFHHAIWFLSVLFFSVSFYSLPLPSMNFIAGLFLTAVLFYLSAVSKLKA